mmetsp:Transcript_47800/g.71130  ORF Transcript_47800/g.71130 Transcript_47800/m.71130 type:complete len:217 (-) Transcript_47800:217-867(-)
MPMAVICLLGLPSMNGMMHLTLIPPWKTPGENEKWKRTLSKLITDPKRITVSRTDRKLKSLFPNNRGIRRIIPRAVAVDREESRPLEAVADRVASPFLNLRHVILRVAETKNQHLEEEQLQEEQEAPAQRIQTAPLGHSKRWVQQQLNHLDLVLAVPTFLVLAQMISRRVRPTHSLPEEVVLEVQLAKSLIHAATRRKVVARACPAHLNPGGACQE